MTLKTLLLGSATAFAVVGGAQAADLSVAEPVDYVRICDAFGTGYWYIPGTDTCLKIGGYVQMDITFHDLKDEWYGVPVHPGNWDMNTEAGVSFSANSMTELGALKSYAEFRGNSDNSSWNGGGNPAGQYLARLDSAWLSLGPFLAGRTGSVYDYGGGYTFDYSDWDPDNGADQVRLSWALSGFGLAIGVEDPRDAWGSSLSTTNGYIPNIVAALTMSQSTWDGQLSAGFAETAAGDGFGAQAGVTIKLDAIAPGDALRLKGAYAMSEASAYGDGNGASWAGGTVWSALASFQHFWTPQLSSAATFSFRDEQGGGIAGTQWEAGGNLVWQPVTGFLAGVEGGYIDPPSSAAPGTNGTWKVKARVKRSF